MKWHDIKEIATRLRNHPTPSEAFLWIFIRNKQLMGRKFLRQHPLIYEISPNSNDYFFFIPDFYCASEKLVIELDGPIHDFQNEKDCYRDKILENMGLRVLRIKNEDLTRMDAVIGKIVQMFVTFRD